MSAGKCNVEVFSRVTGFFRPVQSWNEGKTEEFKDRNKFNIKNIIDKKPNENCRITESVTG